MDGDQSTAWRQSAGQRCHNLGGLEFQRRTSAIGLRGDDQVIFRVGESAARPHLVQQEPMVFAIDHQHDGLFVDGIAAVLAVPGAPVLGKERAKLS